MIGSDILIYRMLYNLVENAIKYNRTGGRVTVTARQKEKHVYLSVEDTGNGIPEELKDRSLLFLFLLTTNNSSNTEGNTASLNANALILYSP